MTIKDFLRWLVVILFGAFVLVPLFWIFASLIFAYMIIPVLDGLP